MKITIGECQGTPGAEELLAEVIAAKTADELVRRQIEGTAAFLFNNVAVTWDGATKTVISGTRPADDAQSTLRKLSKLPKYRRKLVSDDTEIISDIFESELHVKIG